MLLTVRPERVAAAPAANSGPYFSSSTGTNAPSASLTNVISPGRIHVDPNEVAELHLSGGYQVGQRENDAALDGALEVPRTVLGVGPFLQQVVLDRRSATENELVITGGLQNALLNHAQLDLQNLLQVLDPQAS